jgi:alanine racemase
LSHFHTGNGFYDDGDEIGWAACGTRIQPLPQVNTSRSWVELDGAALRWNLSVARGRLASCVKVMAVVKANAYGHGMRGAVEAIQGMVDEFAVANLEEAKQLWEWVDASRITILSPALPAEMTEISDRGFVPMVSAWEEAHAYHRLRERRGPMEIHLCIDTGMGRMGVWEEDALALARAIRGLSGVRVKSLASHLPCADEDGGYTEDQLLRFHRICAEIRADCLPDAQIQIENSAGILGYASLAGDVVRAGLMLYGVSPRAEFQGELKPVLSWKARVSFVREVGTGRSLSYGRTYITAQPMRVATLSVGYADGYQRHLSGSGAEVLVGGLRCAVVGRVTMDQILVDVSGVPGVAAGSEVVLVGRQGEEEVSATELATKAGTIPWEIFTGIGPRVERHWV